MKIGLIEYVHEDLHPAPAGHPENPERMKLALQYVYDSDIGGELEIISPETGDRIPDCLYTVHDRDYLNLIERVAGSGGGALDADTYVSAGSYRAAMTVAGATVDAVRRIVTGDHPVILIAARPPGHHAEYGRAMGFCLINNTAVAAQAAIENHGLKKVAIVDWDVHHGNGTQHIFYRRDDVYYISLHQYPFYPGTGATNEIGEEAGEGFTLNFPLAYGTGDDVYLNIFQEKIIPTLEEYKPELIIITSGFDAHRDDFLAGMNLTEETYGVMTAMLRETAKQFSNGRLLSFFEGGYNPSANGRSLYCHLKGLKGEV